MSWIFWILAGILSILGGFFAFANPFSATLAAKMIAGWGFVFSGIAVLLSLFTPQKSGSKVMSAIVGVCVLLIGIALLKNPLAGVVSLTIMAAFLLVAVGIVRLVWAFGFTDGARWALIFSGVVSLLLSGMIFANFPQSATVMLGIFLAVELISNGVSMMTIAFTKRALEKA